MSKRVLSELGAGKEDSAEVHLERKRRKCVKLVKAKESESDRDTAETDSTSVMKAATDSTTKMADWSLVELAATDKAATDSTTKITDLSLVEMATSKPTDSATVETWRLFNPLKPPRRYTTVPLSDIDIYEYWPEEELCIFSRIFLLCYT